jgi:hypothetical protein
MEYLMPFKSFSTFFSSFYSSSQRSGRKISEQKVEKAKFIDCSFDLQKRVACFMLSQKTRQDVASKIDR